MNCENCGKEHDGLYGSGRFCNSKCARGFSTKIKRKEISEKVSKTLTGRSSPCKDRVYKPRTMKYCCVCGEPTGYWRKTCSTACKNYWHSIKRSQWLQKHGTSNFSTKQTNFSYKFVKNVQCDSKLEEASIIYLVDVFGADQIERFYSILNFWEGEAHRTFNPDWYVRRGDKIFIVEVKMRWSKNSSHDYNRTMPLKKEALTQFCENKGFTMIWLDFDYDPEFRKIYSQHT